MVLVIAAFAPVAIACAVPAPANVELNVVVVDTQSLSFVRLRILWTPIVCYRADRDNFRARRADFRALRCADTVSAIT